MTSTCACALLAMVCLSPPGESSTWGKLTITENLIRREILRLDGDWESGEKPRLVAFLGEKFESPHYEMLTHLSTVEFFFVQDGALDDFAIKGVSGMSALKQLDLTRCEIDATCLSLLSANRELRKIRVEESRLSDQAMDGLTRLHQIETLELNEVDLSDVTDATIERVSCMKSLKSCSFSNCEGMTAARVARLKAAFPNGHFGSPR